MSRLFDEIEESQDELVSITPFHKVKDKSDQELLNWLKKSATRLQKEGRDRHQVQRANLAAYRGIQFGSQRSREGRFRNPERIPTNRLDRFIVNHLFDLTETKVAQLTRQRPSVDILPSTDEFEDKNAARSVKKLIEHLWYINNVDKLDRDTHKYKHVFGEGYVFVLWDKDGGDVHPDFQPGMPLLDEEGNETGKVIKEPVMTGDVKYELEVPWRVLLDKQLKVEDCRFVFRLKSVHIEDLKAEYPSKADKIGEDKDVNLFDMDLLETRKLREHCLQYEFWHVNSKLVPGGAYVKFTGDVILERDKHPYNHGRLPFVRLTDIDIPDKLHGISFYEQIRPIQNMHNNLSTMLAKNIYLMGHAKWVMPRGACKIESLGNDNTIVQYQGPVPPQMLQVAPNPPEAYEYRNLLKEEMEQISGVSGVSRGQPPSGITAAVALQFLNEQEAERANSHIAKRNSFIENLARMTIAVAADYYDPDDGRMMRIMGKDDLTSVEAFDAANLSKSYDIRVKGGSALPEQKSARMQRIIELIQYKPDAMPNEQLIELLEFGNTDRFQSIVTEAVRAAEAENEEILEGRGLPEPQEWEDSIIHWRVHVQLLQKKAFKDKVPPELQEVFFDHVETTEYQMIEQAKKNPLFESKLAQLELFPIFYKDEQFAPQSAEEMEAQAQGAANRGDPTDAEIPAAEAPPLPKQ